MPFFDQYPYTNFHNVNLDWVLQAVKAWGQLVEQNNMAFHNLEEANNSFKTYVTTYLENLDVQDEINNKIESMFRSGVLTEYFLPFISNDVSNWLNENITQPTTPIIDDSLTIDGAGANSLTVGQRFNNLDDTISNLPNIIFSERAKTALLELLRHIGVWDNELASVYYNNLYNELLGTVLDWDIIWNYTDGMPQNAGFEVNINGTGSTASMTDNGLLLTVPNTSGSDIRIRYRLESRHIIYRKTVAEWTFLINAYGSTAMQENTYGYGVRLYNGLGYNPDNIPTSYPGGGLVFKGHYIMYRNETPAWEILNSVEPLETDTFHTVRIIVEYNVGITMLLDENIIKFMSWSGNGELISNPNFVVTLGTIATIKDFKLKFYN